MIQSVSEVSDRLTRPSFDQRPDALVSTRGRDRVPLVVGHRCRDGGDWQVALLGLLVDVALTPAQARVLATQLVGMAEVLELGPRL